MNGTPKPIKKILYAAPRGLGDMVFSLPLLHSLRMAFPHCEIYIPIHNSPVKQQMLALIGFTRATPNHLPRSFEDPIARKRLHASRSGNRSEKVRFESQILAKYLAGERYDLAIIPKPFTIETLDCDRQISELELTGAGLDLNVHMVERFLLFATYLGIAPEMDFTLAFDGEKDPVLASGWRIGSDKHFVVINLSASQANKKWTARGYREVTKWCCDHGFAVVLVGGRDDCDIARKIQRRVQVLNTISPMGYSMDLENFARLASRARVVMGADSGLLHVADAVGAKVIGLYGPTTPERFGPFRNRQNVVSRYHIDGVVENIESADVLKTLESVLQITTK
jgi:ADP-heptose:LPS heptosyltransferase